MINLAVSHSDSETTLTHDDKIDGGHFENPGHFSERSYDHANSKNFPDIYALQPHVEVKFDALFHDPMALEDGDIGKVLSPSLRRLLNFVYSYSQGAIYYFLTIVTGVPLGILWGVCFGLLNYIIVWYTQPVLKLFYMGLRIVGMPCAAFIRTFIDPIFQSIGQVFSYIFARFKIKLYGDSDENKISGCGSPKMKHRKKRNRNSFSYPPEWLGFV